MKIYKSDIRRALEVWKLTEKRANTRYECEYESPALSASFVRKIAKMLGLPTSAKYVALLRPYIREMKEEGVI